MLSTWWLGPRLFFDVLCEAVFGIVVCILVLVHTIFKRLLVRTPSASTAAEAVEAEEEWEEDEEDKGLVPLLRLVLPPRYTFAQNYKPFALATKTTRI